MVTREQLRNQLGKWPFEPFQVVVAGGDTIDIIRRFQAVVTKTQLVVSVKDHLHWIQLSKLDRLLLADGGP